MYIPITSLLEHTPRLTRRYETSLRELEARLIKHGYLRAHIDTFGGTHTALAIADVLWHCWHITPELRVLVRRNAVRAEIADTLKSAPKAYVMWTQNYLDKLNEVLDG